MLFNLSAYFMFNPFLLQISVFWPPVHPHHHHGDGDGDIDYHELLCRSGEHAPVTVRRGRV